MGYLPEHFARLWIATGRMKALLSPETRIVSPFVLVTHGQPRPPLLERLLVRELLACTAAATRAGDASHQQARCKG